MKKFISIVIATIIVHLSIAQGVGVGTSTPNPSAALDVTSVTQGMLVPRMTTAQRISISNAANGLLVYDITTETFWFYNDGWLELIDSAHKEVYRSAPDKIYAGMTDKVGIGTSDPLHKLQVKTADNQYGISHTNGSVDVATYVSSTAGGFFGTKSNHTFQLYANDGINQFALTPTGNVGIGTGSPLQKLHVEGNTCITQNLGIGTSVPNAPIQFATTTANRKIVLYEVYNNDHQFFGFGVNPDGSLRYQTPVNANDHAFYSAINGTSSLELMRIKGNGNVGIGNSAPLQKLHVEGNTYISQKLGIGTSAPNAPIQLASTVANRKVVLYDNNNNDHQYYGLGINPYTLRYQVPGTTDSHIFYAGTSPTTSNELLRITGNGNVGIGINAPVATLDIARGPSFDGTLIVRGTTHWSHFNYGTAENTYIRSGKAGSHIILNELDGLGNIGIGTSDPIQKLSVEGSAYVSQNLGIGTSSPAQKLHVEGNTYISQKLGIGNSAPNAPIQFDNTVANRKVVLYDESNNDHQFFGLGINPNVMRYQVNDISADHVFYAGNSGTTSTELMRIRGNGDVDVAGKLEIGYIRVNGPWVNVSPVSWAFATCDCPAGTFVLGGGYNNENVNMRTKDNGANSNTSWGAYTYNPDIFTTFQTRATAICARLAY